MYEKTSCDQGAYGGRWRHRQDHILTFELAQDIYRGDAHNRCRDLY
jgi:hypothetical protein